MCGIGEGNSTLKIQEASLASSTQTWLTMGNQRFWIKEAAKSLAKKSACQKNWQSGLWVTFLPKMKSNEFVITSYWGNSQWTHTDTDCVSLAEARGIGLSGAGDGESRGAAGIGEGCSTSGKAGGLAVFSLGKRKNPLNNNNSTVKQAPTEYKSSFDLYFSKFPKYLDFPVVGKLFHNKRKTNK